MRHGSKDRNTGLKFAHIMGSCLLPSTRSPTLSQSCVPSMAPYQWGLEVYAKETEPEKLRAQGHPAHLGAREENGTEIKEIEVQ